METMKEDFTSKLLIKEMLEIKFVVNVKNNKLIRGE